PPPPRLPLSPSTTLFRSAGVDVLHQAGARRGAVALPQLAAVDAVVGREVQPPAGRNQPVRVRAQAARLDVADQPGAGGGAVGERSEEHTSELQSLTNLVC